MTPCDAPINDIMGMFWDQVHQHDLRVQQDGEQSENLHDKLRLVLTNTLGEDYELSFRHYYLTAQQRLEFLQMVGESQVA